MSKSTLVFIVLAFLICHQFTNAQYYGYSGYYNPYPVYYSPGGGLDGNPLSTGPGDLGSGNSLASIFLACSHCNRG